MNGRGAVVTGGGRGIGAAVARALAKAGASVVVAARTRAEIDGIAAELRQDGHPAWAILCDVSDAGSVRALTRSAAEHLPTIDILVNNAGTASSAPLAATTLEEWNRIMGVNATGTFLCTQAFLPGMLERKWGRIVNVASVAGLMGAPYIAAYVAAKHAVVGFTRAAAAEVAARGITVNAVCPGYVDTPMTQDSLARIAAMTGRSKEEALEALLKMNPQHRLIEPEEVAHAVLALCDEKAKGINGQTLALHGGGMMG